VRRPLAFLLAAFALAVPPAGAGAGPAEPSEIEATLLRYAAGALAEGDLETARSRYRRLAAGNPRSARARAGLGDVAVAAGDADAARRHYEGALEIDPALAAANLGLAELARAAGDADAARARLDAAIAREPLDPQLHARLFEWTGLAPEAPAADAAPEEVRALAAAHPYDPRTQLAAARLAREEGDAEAARAHVQTALLVADLAPDTAPATAALLAGLDDAERRFVPVHVLADQTVRDRTGWAFELRIAWGRASAALQPLLSTTFVPVSIRPFSSEGVPDDLASIHRAMGASLATGAPAQGIVAGFTRRASPRTPLARRQGQATYFGRDLLVRLDPRDREGRTLAHEVLHLYGAMHLATDEPSLMNPMGGAWRLDAHNARIVRAASGRRFAAGGFEADVLDRTDVGALADALVAALRVNVAFRNAELAEALAERSRVVAGLEARKATVEDQPLAQVAEVTAWVLLRANRPVQAIRMLESAARLWGPTTAEAQAAQAQADAWRTTYKSFLD